MFLCNASRFFLKMFYLSITPHFTYQCMTLTYYCSNKLFAFSIPVFDMCNYHLRHSCRYNIIVIRKAFKNIFLLELEKKDNEFPGTSLSTLRAEYASRVKVILNSRNI